MLRTVWITAVATVVIGSIIPLEAPTGAPEHADKLQHFAGYTLLAGLATLSFSSTHRARQAAAAMFGLGVTIELVQYGLPWRSFEWLDILANGLGTAAGIALGNTVRRRLRYPTTHA